MTNISKKKISGKDFTFANKKLVNLIAKLKSKNAHYLLDELLTESERIMLIKRYAAIFMFNQSYSPYRVGKTLGMSNSTVHRLFKHYQEASFHNLLSCLDRKEKSEFLAILNDLIIAQASPRARARLLNRALK